MDEIIKSKHDMILYNMLHIYLRCEMSAHIIISSLLSYLQFYLIMSMYSTQGKLSSVSKYDLDSLEDIHITCNSNVLNNVYSTYDKSILIDIDPVINYLHSSGNLINWEYFNETTFMNTLTINTCFSMFHLKIRSVPLNFSELLTYLDVLEIEFKMIALSKTTIKNTHVIYDIPNYNVEMKYIGRKRGGGVSLYS